MRVLIASDAWRPQINGVVRSLEQMALHAGAFGAELSFLTPDRFATMALPTYGEIRLALARPKVVWQMLRDFAPTHVHIATEGPIGWVTRAVCLRHGMPFTTSYHTRFPEYLASRAPVPASLSYAVLRRFHNGGHGIMVSSPSLEKELSERGFRNLRRWSRGVDTDLFRPRPGSRSAMPGPVFLYVGRVAVEKNLEAFLSLDLPGSKLVVGDGPARERLEKQYPTCVFAGTLQGEALAQAYASADVFVFPSLTDTFGIVLLEALASGLPVAAYPVTGPIDVLGRSGCGALSPDLREAALQCLEIPRERCREHASSYSWRESAQQFFNNLSALPEQLDQNAAAPAWV